MADQTDGNVASNVLRIVHYREAALTMEQQAPPDDTEIN